MLSNAIVLFSGGIESTVLAYFLRKEFNVLLLQFDYGSKQFVEENILLRYHSVRLSCNYRVVDLKSFFAASVQRNALCGFLDLDEKKDQEDKSLTTVPFRNGIFLTTAASLAMELSYSNVSIGCHEGEFNEDTKPSFLGNMRFAIRAGSGSKVDLLVPFLEKTKSEIIRIGIELGVNFKYTYSCYVGKEKHCGRCAACIDRRNAFRQAKVPDQTIYLSE